MTLTYFKIIKRLSTHHLANIFLFGSSRSVTHTTNYFFFVISCKVMQIIQSFGQLEYLKTNGQTYLYLPPYHNKQEKNLVLLSFPHPVSLSSAKVYGRVSQGGTICVFSVIGEGCTAIACTNHGILYITGKLIFLTINLCCQM